MKQLIILTAFLTVALSYPVVKTWPFNELYDAYYKLPAGAPMKKYFEQAVELLVEPIFKGKNPPFGHVIVPSPTGARNWTKKQLKKSSNDTNLVIRWAAQRELKNMTKRKTATIAVPAVDISIWTFPDVKKYIRDPKTKPALLPFLKKAQKDFKKVKGKNKGNMTMVTPVNLMPIKPGKHPYPMEYVFQKISF